MSRLSVAFVTICMIIVAGALGAVGFLGLRLSGAEAGLLALAALFGLALWQNHATRNRDQGDLGQRLGDLSRATGELAARVGELGRRIQNAENAADRTRQAQEPMKAELAELGDLLRDITETLTHHEEALETLRQPAARPAQVAAAAASPAPAAPVAASQGNARVSDRAALEPPQEQLPPNGYFAGRDRAEVYGQIRRAIEESRIELHLQPVVTLPQRKVRWYEAFSRMRAADGQLLQPSDFMPAATEGGLMPALDNLVVLRCVQVIRRLQVRNQEVGLFVNLSQSALLDGGFISQLVDFLKANTAIASALVFEISQAALRALGPVESEGLAAITDMGFRLSVDQVTDLRIDARDLADRGVRFLKVPAEMLLHRAGSSGAEIHPADLSNHLSRFGVELVAVKIESEGMVVDLLDHFVHYGQGFLFSAPRPVRPEVLRGVPDQPRPTPVPQPVPQPVPVAAAPVQAASLSAAEPTLGAAIAASMAADTLRESEPPRRRGSLAALARSSLRRN